MIFDAPRRVPGTVVRTLVPHPPRVGEEGEAEPSAQQVDVELPGKRGGKDLFVRDPGHELAGVSRQLDVRRHRHSATTARAL